MLRRRTSYSRRKHRRPASSHILCSPAAKGVLRPSDCASVRSTVLAGSPQRQAGLRGSCCGAPACGEQFLKQGDMGLLVASARPSKVGAHACSLLAGVLVQARLCLLYKLVVMPRRQAAALLVQARRAAATNPCTETHIALPSCPAFSSPLRPPPSECGMQHIHPYRRPGQSISHWYTLALSSKHVKNIDATAPGNGRSSEPTPPPQCGTPACLLPRPVLARRDPLGARAPLPPPALFQRR